MTEIVANDHVVKIREKLAAIQRRGVLTIRGATSRNGGQASPKTVELMVRALEMQEYAESLQIALAITEEDAANASDEKTLAELAQELDRVGGALRERLSPKPKEARLERFGGP